MNDSSSSSGVQVASSMCDTTVRLHSLSNDIAKYSPYLGIEPQALTHKRVVRASHALHQFVGLQINHPVVESGEDEVIFFIVQQR